MWSVVESDLAAYRPHMGRVNEFHVLVFDPSHPAPSSTAQTRGMSSVPATAAAAHTARPVSHTKVLQLTAFLDLGLAEPITKALADEKYTIPTPIQAQTIPQVMQGRDVVGIAQTGTGKTAAFALPDPPSPLQQPPARAAQSCRVLVLSPTRELVVADRRQLQGLRPLSAPDRCARHRRRGMNPQMRALAHGVDVLVATPGRLLDLMEHGPCNSTASRCSCSTRPTACSTWASSTTSGASSASCRPSARRCSSRRPCRGRSPSSPIPC